MLGCADCHLSEKYGSCVKRNFRSYCLKKLKFGQVFFCIAALNVIINYTKLSWKFYFSFHYFGSWYLILTFKIKKDNFHLTLVIFLKEHKASWSCLSFWWSLQINSAFKIFKKILSYRVISVVSRMIFIPLW